METKLCSEQRAWLIANSTAEKTYTTISRLGHSFLVARSLLLIQGPVNHYWNGRGGSRFAQFEERGETDIAGFLATSDEEMGKSALYLRASTRHKM